MICSRQNSGDKVLAAVYAHLLQPVIDRIDEAFRVRNEQTRNTPSPTSYNMKDHYKPNVLRNIKYGLGIDDEPTKLVINVIVEFGNAVSLSKMQMVELLISEATRNFSVHGYIEHFIDNLVRGEHTPDDFIEHIEKENKVELSISNKQKDILIKLLQYNIHLHQNL
jgi:hypothetical protein